MVETDCYRNCDASCSDTDRAATGAPVVLPPALDRAVIQYRAGGVVSHSTGHRCAAGSQIQGRRGGAAPSGPEFAGGVGAPALQRGIVEDCASRAASRGESRVGEHRACLEAGLVQICIHRVADAVRIRI